MKILDSSVSLLNNNGVEEFSNLHDFEIKNTDNLEIAVKARKKYEHKKITGILNDPIKFPIYLSVSEAAKIGGVQTKTVRRAIQTKVVIYKIIKNRYLIDLGSLIKFLHTKTKLRNKLTENGIGQFVERWKK